MKRRKLFIGIMLLSTISLFSQTITVKKTYRLLEGKSGFYPTFNKEGNMLAFTTNAFQGLNIYDFGSKKIITITDEAGAGYDPVFSNDNSKIFYKNTVYKSNLRHTGIKSFDLASNTSKEMLTPRRNVAPAQSFHNGFVVVSDKKLLKTTFGTVTEPVSNYVWSDGTNLNIYKDGKTTVLNPVKDASGYIWASLSPDGKKILFHAAAKGTYVCDLNGKIIASLGHLNAPAWYGNDYVVGMRDLDDGHDVTESTVIMKSVDGKIEKQLSLTEHIAMYPTASAAAEKIAYNTDKGEIYIVELNINR